MFLYVKNRFTIARLYYETGITHLFCFSDDGKVLYKTNLNINNDSVGDFVVDKYTNRSNNRLICSSSNKIQYYQF